MKILILGRGPVAQALLASLPPGHDLTVGLREAPDGPFDAAIARARRQRQRQQLVRVQVPALESPRETGRNSWDVVITTAPVNSSALEQVLLCSPAAVLASVTQVPSEVDALRRAAGSRAWSLVTPQFIATRDTPVRWWQPGPMTFTLAGPGAGSLSAVLSGGAARFRRVELAAPLLGAATSMPFIAGLQAARYDRRVLYRRLPEVTRAASQARAAVAAEYGARAPRLLGPGAAGLVLQLLPRLAPLDLWSYVREHFGNHTAQTRQMLEDWLELGRLHDLPTDALKALHDSFVMAT